MTLDDLDDLFTETPATVNVTTKKCRRHVWTRFHESPFTKYIHSAPGCSADDHRDVFICARCPAVRDPAKSRRARNNKSRGLAIQRRRIEGLGGTNLAGNNENLDGIGLRFAFESKSGSGAFSERYWRWLTGIPMTADRTPVLIVTDAPGSGHKSRSYVVVRYDDWKDLHGE